MGKILVVSGANAPRIQKGMDSAKTNKKKLNGGLFIADSVLFFII